jgi:hypothetical protein
MQAFTSLRKICFVANPIPLASLGSYPVDIEFSFPLSSLYKLALSLIARVLG